LIADPAARLSHEFTCRVYYEDTDMAGIVYYANYLKFIERARSKFVRELGVDQSDMRLNQNMVFAVRKLVADYLKPAVFDRDHYAALGHSGAAFVEPRCDAR
jgi:acyl-CoA thioester hydrolase